jgi:hypothetical protein
MSSALQAIWNAVQMERRATLAALLQERTELLAAKLLVSEYPVVRELLDDRFADVVETIALTRRLLGEPHE